MASQVVSWSVLAHMIYSSIPDPQHHARVWMRFQSNFINSNFHDFPCVTNKHLGQKYLKFDDLQCVTYY